jgi:hypothetical protein
LLGIGGFLMYSSIEFLALDETYHFLYRLCSLDQTGTAALDRNGIKTGIAPWFSADRQQNLTLTLTWLWT